MNDKKSLARRIILGMLLATVPATAWAVDPQRPYDAPDSGQILSEMETSRHIDPNPSKPEIDMNIPEVERPEHEVTIKVSKIIFDCDEMQVEDELQPLVADKLNKELSFKELQQIAIEATTKLRNQGYMTSIVYIPAQDVDDGVIHMKTIIGRFGNVNITNKSGLTDDRVLGFTYPVRPGQLIKSQPVDKSLLVLNDIPGIIAKASLQPGVKPGTAQINIDVENLEKQRMAIYVDNYGGKSTGRWRYGFNYNYNNLTHVGDSLELNYMGSFGDMHNYMARYKVPVGRDGAFMRVDASHTNYELGNKWKSSDIAGLSNTYEIGITVPMRRTLYHSSFYDICYRYRTLTDSWFNHLLETKKSSNTLNLEVHGYEREKKDSLSYNISHTIGDLNMDNKLAKSWDTTLHTEGGFNKSNMSLYYIHNFDNRWQVHTSFTGQYGWTNLDSSENFYIGGASGVRAFPQGESGGNSGILGTVEARYTTGLEGLQLAAFVDGGRVWYNYEPDATTTENTRNLVGAGLGVIYSKSRDWYARLDWATPIGNHKSKSEGQDIHNTYWLRVVKQL